jgi:toxin-antitoxin system PIN domain toxin
MARVALLDVNVIVALLSGDHVHHDAAHDWFADAGQRGWATTPLTENGAIRVLSNPAVHAAALTASSIRDHLRRFCGLDGHRFWPSDVSLLEADVLTPHAPITHRQLTDIYLLALAVRHDGCLATFDTSIPLPVVKGATRKHLLTLGGG